MTGGVWLDGKALEALSPPWPTAELGPEERAALYGPHRGDLLPAPPRRVDAVSELVLAALAKGPLSAAELVARLGAKATVYRAIMRLRRAGRIERTGGRLKNDGEGGLRRYGGWWALATRQEAPGCP